MAIDISEISLTDQNIQSTFLFSIPTYIHPALVYFQNFDIK